MVLGEPTVLEVEREGEARTSLEAPPPLLDCAPGPCDAVAAEDASCEAALGAMVLEREDSSWLAGSCCPAGEKGAEVVDEAADDLRLPTRREEAAGREGKLAVAGEYAAREVLGSVGLRWSCAMAVDMGVKRVL